MADDKASILLGQPGGPVSCTARQRPILGGGQPATDHDQSTPQRLTPSLLVSLRPTSTNWYNGSPHVTLKCAIFEPSNATRHAAEFKQFVNQPNLFVATDEGSDHNITHVSIIIAHMALFWICDLDYLCCVRTPPKLSSLGPWERFMSILNIGMYGLALQVEDSDISDVEAARARSFGSKKAWRNAEEKEQKSNKPDESKIAFRKVALKRTRKARNILKERWEALVYKGNKFTMEGRTSKHFRRQCNV